MGEVSVLAGTQRRRLWRLEELPARAVDGERERALGELEAGLVKHQTVGTRLVDDLEGGFRVSKIARAFCCAFMHPSVRTSPSLHS